MHPSAYAAYSYLALLSIEALATPRKAEGTLRAYASKLWLAFVPIAAHAGRERITKFALEKQNSGVCMRDENSAAIGHVQASVPAPLGR